MVQWKETLPAIEVPRTALDWKALGDQHFRDKEHFPAAVAYTNGLQIDADTIALILNRSMAHLLSVNCAAVLRHTEDSVNIPGFSNLQNLKVPIRACTTE